MAVNSHPKLVRISHSAYLVTRNHREHSLRLIECQQELVTNLIPMKDLGASSPNGGFNIIEVVQVKMQVSVIAVNQYEEQSIPFEKL